jgi:UDP-GlcNAc:undecaprenyl-phosphate GlcNAc-1-phosphate transferase
MYLGDTGSMLIGAVLGALAMVGRYSERNAVSSWFVPLALCAIPLFDLALVIIARVKANREVWMGSPDHFAVRLRHHGVSASTTARLAALLGTLTVAAGVGSTFLANAAALVVFAVITTIGAALLVLLFVRFPPRPPSSP